MNSASRIRSLSNATFSTPRGSMNTNASSSTAAIVATIPGTKPPSEAAITTAAIDGMNPMSRSTASLSASLTMAIAPTPARPTRTGTAAIRRRRQAPIRRGPAAGRDGMRAQPGLGAA